MEHYMLVIDFAIKRFKSISTIYDSEISLDLNPLKCFFSFDNQHLLSSIYWIVWKRSWGDFRD